MEILLYASAVIAALSLLLIAIYVIIALKSAKQTMKDVSDTISRMETKLNGVTVKSESLMDKTNQIAADVENKLQRLEGLSRSADNLNQSTNHLNRSFETLSTEIENPSRKYKDLMQKASLLTETASRMYYKVKKEKARHQNTTYPVQKELPSPRQTNY